ncbi:unnamed protein product [Urochloa humidicola]
MNASQFMDKQIQGLAASAAAAASSPPASGGLADLMSPDPQEEAESHAHRPHHGGANGTGADEVLPSYGFQPIRPATSASAVPVVSAPAAGAWGSHDSNSIKSSGVLEPHHVLKKVSHEEERSNFTAVTIVDIDHTMKKYADNLLHALEGVSSRLSQLEDRTYNLENSVGELKLTIGNNNGSTDGKLRQFENTLREVQAGVQILRDKQEIVETQIQLAKLQVPKAEDVQPENADAGHAGSQQQPTPPQQTIQSQNQAPPSSQPPAPLPALPAPTAPPPPLPIQNQPPPHFPGHVPHSQVPSVPPSLSAPSVPSIPQESYYPPSAQPTDATHQQYQAPPGPQTQAAPAPPPQHYQTPPQFAQYSQPPPPANVNPSLPPPVSQQPEEPAPYGPPTQSYPPNVRPPLPYMPPPSGPVAPFYGPNHGMYEAPAVRPSSGPPPPYSAGYKPPAAGGFSDSYGYSGSPSHRANAGMKPPSPFAPPGGGSGYGRLPTAQVLPQAAPVSSTPSGSSGTRVPIDDVIDKVATMGFSKEQVRATVRKLTENGQNVDLNVVLDKLMNDADAQPQRGWGDPTMYEAFWREVGRRAATVIRGWEATSYFSDAAALCWFLEPDLEREVRRLHRVVGNAAADDGYHLVVGTGATQLYQAAMYALSSSMARRDTPVPVVSPAPYYSSYPPQTDLQLSGLYLWAGDANTFAGGECIELVCSPNNPDGAIREAVTSGKPIHDLVYYWPQYTPITEPAAHDIMLFTVSKVTGHAGTRLGWALVKDREVARKMVYFVDRSTIGVSKESQLRATKILGVVSDAYESPPAAGPGVTPVPRLFDFARRRMEERWRTLRDTVAATGTFSLPEETIGYCEFNKRTVTACPALAWLRCEKEGVEDCAEFLAGHKIVARGGEQFGGDARCVRINMLDRDQVFDLLVQRLSAINRTEQVEAE